jgi:outer membrane protein assembly factor BamB
LFSAAIPLMLIAQEMLARMILVFLLPSTIKGPIAMRTLFFALSLVATLIVQTSIGWSQTKPAVLDWPYWRGPEGNSISRETGLPDTINPAGGDGSNLLWKVEAAGGRSTPIVLNGKLYTLTRDQPGTAVEGEKVMCVDISTGKTVWENRFNVYLSDVPDTRVGWSSVVGDPATGNIFALGVCGVFQCINGETGKTIWKIPLHETFGMLSTYGGRTNFPIVVDNHVILGAVIIGWGEMARPAHRILAFDKQTGEVAWFTSTRPLPEDTIYCGPTVCVIGGQKLLLTGSGDGWLYALQPQTGKIVWEYQFSRRGLNLSPTVVGETVFISHSEENPTGTKMGAVAAINGALTGNITATGELWKQLEIAAGKASLLHVDGRLYCFDDAGKLFVLDAKTGAQIGKKISLGTMNFATPVFADGKIYHVEKNGRWYIMTPDEKEGVKKFQRGKTMGNFPTDHGDECWSSPIVSHGKLFIQTTGALYCFADTTKKAGNTALPESAKETAAGADDQPALVQVVPAELLLRSGESKKLTVKLFNSRGQFLKEVTDATFSVEGKGEVKEGTFTSPAGAQHEAAIVTAKVGELTGRSRIRLVPPLPWKFDFEGMKDAPITWVGARYRHQVRPVEGNNVMVKITTIPKGTRSRCWFGQTDLHDYTIQADMKASVQDDKLPDLGLLNSGYKFVIEGETKRLVLNSWDSHDYRVAKILPAELVPNAWYSLKMKVANSNGKAIVQAKIWKRDAAEPKEWSIEITDPMPNTQGSPGLFGNATNAEITIDNVTVVANE